MYKQICLLIFFVLSVGCNSKVIKQSTETQEKVTIYRDDFGVAHVYGEDDESAAFGFAYAMAEDNFNLILENYIHALGRSAELVGEEGLLDDWVNRSLEITRVSQNEYTQLGPEARALCRGYVAGLNYYAKTHPEANMYIIDKFEPWHPLAFINYIYYQRVLLPGYSRLPQESITNAFKKLNGIKENDLVSLSLRNKQQEGEGSNSWAINGTKSATGNAMLFINPHLPWFGPAQVYEAHIMSGSGWNFTGYTRFGFPLPYVGHNTSIGWASTDNAADLVDAYYEYFTKEDDSLAYEYENAYRKASTWKDSIRIKTDSGLVARELTFMKTHHGPVISYKDDIPVSVRMARYETPGWIEQWYDMTKAHDLKSFREAVEPLEVQFGNFMYADKEGNIWYVYNGAIPKRNEGYDWSKPVNGNIKDTEWLGYHSLDELPQIFNPEAHWMQNCNGTPLLGSAPNDAPKPEDYPSYMIVEEDNLRSEHARRILQETETFSFETFKNSTYATYLISAEKDIPMLLEEANKIELSPDEQDAIHLLKTWDKVSRTESIETTLYILLVYAAWLEEHESDSGVISFMSGLKKTMNQLQESHGSWKVAWGDIQRMQRPPDHTAVQTHFKDLLPSIPVHGAPSWTGSIYIVNSNPDITENRYMYGEHGNSYVSIIEFGDRIKSGSLHPFGPSGDATSPHYFDQAERHSKGNYKPTYLYLEDIQANAKETYAPGKR